MILHAIGSVVGGAILTGVSLTKSIPKQLCEGVVGGEFGDCEAATDFVSRGAPFSFVNDLDETASEGQQLIASTFDVAPAVASFVFWALIAFIALKILGWIFKELSQVAFIVAIVVLVGGYVGWLSFI